MPMPSTRRKTSDPAAPAAAAEYRLGAGDVVRIVVYQNPDLTLESDKFTPDELAACRGKPTVYSSLRIKAKVKG